MKAKLLLRYKETDEDGDLREMIVWRVPESRMYKDGVRYRLVFIPLGARRPAVLYDNHHPKGHHKHLDDLEQPYIFSGLEKLKTDFDMDMQFWKNRRSTFP